MTSQTDEGADPGQVELPEELRLPSLLAAARSDDVLRQELATAGIDDAEALESLEAEEERIYASAQPETAALNAQLQNLEQARSRLDQVRAEAIRPVLELVLLMSVVLPLGVAVAAVVDAIAGDAVASAGWLRVVVPVGTGIIAVVVGMLWVRHNRARRIGEADADVRNARVAVKIATGRLRRALVESSVREILRDLVGREEDLAFGTTLAVEDPQGLAEVESLELTIPTAGRERLTRLLDAMPGGSIAIAGARGAGKTTLMRSLCPTDGEVTAEHLAVMVPAPVNYGAREYVLHLFGELCGLVLGEERVARLRDPGPGDPLAFRGPRIARLAAYAGMATALLGWTLIVFDWVGIRPGNVPLLDGLTDQALLGMALLLIGVVAAYGGFAVGRRHFRESYRPPHPAFPAPGSGLGDAAWQRLQRSAEEHLREIWFQQSYSTGWSGSLTGAGLALGVEASRDLSRHQMSLPDIVRNLRRFVSEVPDGMRVIIGIDELDKMAGDEIAQFLKEIKVIFGMRDCFYLLSISEDALSSFERRGLPLRDVFDSSFDESLYVRPFDAEETTTLLQRRLLGMPIPFIMLCHCIAGALPRDTIRVAREVVALNAERPRDRGLGEIARAIVSIDVEAKARAALVRVSDMEPAGATRQLVAWLRELQGEEVTAQRLLARYDASADTLSEALDRSAGKASQLAHELTAFCLFSATVLEFFSDDRQPSELRAAYDADEGVRPIDALAAARQAFSVSPEAARDVLLAFREDHRLEPTATATPTAPVAARNGGLAGRMAQALALVRGPWTPVAASPRDRR